MSRERLSKQPGWAGVRDSGTAGNLTSDAHLAAVALELGASVCSTDGDFERFAGVERVSPLR